MKKSFLITVLFLAAGTAIWAAERKREVLETDHAAIEKIAYRASDEICEECPRAALTFDDGPSKKYTPVLLDGLKERGVKASFFLLGRNIEGNEELVKRMYEEGHLIGNHTYNHVRLTKVSKNKAKEEIEKTGNKIYETTGGYQIYLRPPFGEVRKDLDLPVELFYVSWNIDTLDWKTRNVDSILRIVKKQIKDGSIILMHDEYETSVEAALRIVDDLMNEGYQFVTVDKLLLP